MSAPQCSGTRDLGAFPQSLPPDTYLALSKLEEKHNKEFLNKILVSLKIKIKQPKFKQYCQRVYSVSTFII